MVVGPRFCNRSVRWTWNRCKSVDVSPVRQAAGDQLEPAAPTRPHRASPGRTASLSIPCPSGRFPAHEDPIAVEVAKRHAYAPGSLLRLAVELHAERFHPRIVRSAVRGVDPEQRETAALAADQRLVLGRLRASERE